MLRNGLEEQKEQVSSVSVALIPVSFRQLPRHSRPPVWRQNWACQVRLRGPSYNNYPVMPRYEETCVRWLSLDMQGLGTSPVRGTLVYPRVVLLAAQL